MEVAVLLKVVGGLSSGVGSLILAYRGFVIFKWVKYTLFAHEKSIDALVSAIYNTKPVYDGKIIMRSLDQLLKLEDKLGSWLLIIGIVMFGVGMIATAISYFFA
ncbi:MULTISPECIES: hypothetical protein [unclassified Acinetobacter]|uniref:hypothetical protein n=1 Tax=unclassified Acinetobacter TaxID=196816 RepID=UPI001250631D|nr:MULTISPECIES: hypothetical protein [unclassified Acinetobacter]